MSLDNIPTGLYLRRSSTILERSDHEAVEHLPYLRWKLRAGDEVLCAMPRGRAAPHAVLRDAGRGVQGSEGPDHAREVDEGRDHLDGLGQPPRPHHRPLQARQQFPDQPRLRERPGDRPAVRRVQRPGQGHDAVARDVLGRSIRNADRPIRGELDVQPRQTGAGIAALEVVSGQPGAASPRASDPAPTATPPDKPRPIRAARGCGIPTPHGTRLPRPACGTLLRRERRNSTALRRAASRPSHRPRCRRRCLRRARTARAALPSSRARPKVRWSVPAGLSTMQADRRSPPAGRRAARSRARRSANAGSGGLLGNSSQRASSGPSLYADVARSLSTIAEASGPSCLRNHASAADAPFAARKAFQALNCTLEALSGGTFWLSSAYSSKACAAAPAFAIGDPSSRIESGWMPAWSSASIARFTSAAGRLRNTSANRSPISRKSLRVSEAGGCARMSAAPASS